MSNKILIAGSAYIDNEGLRELCKLWTRVVAQLDPDIDVVIIDSCSPWEPGAFLNWPVWAPEREGRDLIMSETEIPVRKWVYRFPDNVGHLSRGGEDGAGRTFCKAMELAIAGGYDYLAVIETDLIFLRSVREVVHRMQMNGSVACAVPNFQYQFPEFGLSFFDVHWLREFGFVEKYDWKRSQPWPIPEIRIMNMIKDYLVLLPLYGIRIDKTGVTPENLSQVFPYFPPAWVTHAQDLNVYLRAIMLNNIQLP